MIPNAYCKKHDEMEPNDWDFNYDGLWVCPQCSRESMKKLTKRLPCGRKPLDVALEKIEKQFKDKYES